MESVTSATEKQNVQRSKNKENWQPVSGLCDQQAAAVQQSTELLNMHHTPMEAGPVRF